MGVRTDSEWTESHTFVTLAASHGLDVKQTAEIRHLSEWTVRQYRREAMLILDAANMIEAVAKAIRDGIIKLKGEPQ